MKAGFPNLDSYLEKTFFFLSLHGFIHLCQLGLGWKQMACDGVASAAVNPSTG